MDIAGILGILGFALAFVLGIVEWRRYHIPLRFGVREIEASRSPDGIYFLTLLCLTFVNPASAGRTVYNILTDKPSNAIALQPPYEYVENYAALKYWIPKHPWVEMKISEDKILRLPLDIPPHQSQSKWLPLLFQMEEAVVGFDIPAVRIVIVAKDISGKTIARFDETVELKTHIIY